MSQSNEVDTVADRLRSAAAEERRLLRDEAAAERRLLKAQEKLQQAEGKLADARARVDRRAKRVEEAAERLMAVQTNRANLTHRADVTAGDENAPTGEAAVEEIVSI